MALFNSWYSCGPKTPAEYERRLGPYGISKSQQSMIQRMYDECLRFCRPKRVLTKVQIKILFSIWTGRSRNEAVVTSRGWGRPPWLMRLLLCMVLTCPEAVVLCLGECTIYTSIKKHWTLSDVATHRIYQEHTNSNSTIVLCLGECTIYTCIEWHWR